MLGGFGSSTSAGLASGGTVDGDLIVTGDFKVEGAGSFAFDEIIEISSHSIDAGINPIFIPLTADCFFYLKENSYQFEKLSKYFTNTSQIDCLKFVEKYRDTFCRECSRNIKESLYI